MFESIINFFKNLGRADKNKESSKSKDTAKERLHLVLMQDRANMSADFLDLMKQEIIEVIKKYIAIDENAIDVRLTNKQNEDGTVGAPALYANIPIVSVKEEAKKEIKKEENVPEENKNENNDAQNTDNKKEEKKEEKEDKKENKEKDNKKEEKPEEQVENKDEKADSVSEEEKPKEAESVQ